MATKKLQVLANLGPTDAKIKSAVEEHFVDHPIDSTLIDKLCPAFTESGSVVTCEPVEGHPLQVVSKLSLVQSGTGDPTPDNIRPITGHAAVQLSQSNESEERTFALDLGRTVYGGSLDWSTGLLTIQWARKTMTSFTKVSTPGWAAYVMTTKMDYADNTKTIVQCSHYKGGVWVSPIPDNYVYAANDTTLSFRDKTHFGSLEAANAYLEEQNAAGTPVQICYKLKTPTTVQLTPQEICALAGVNTIYSDTGNTTVTGRADPNYIIDTLLDRVAALEAAAVNNA